MKYNYPQQQKLVYSATHTRSFKKSPTKIGYYQSLHNDYSNNDKKQKLKNYNWTPYNNSQFNNIKKLPQQYSTLRQTLNTYATQTNYDENQYYQSPYLKKKDNYLQKSSVVKRNQNESFKFNNNQNGLAHSMVGFKKMRNHSTIQSQPIFGNPPTLKSFNSENEKSQYDKINQKLLNNAKMINQLKKLKQQRKNKFQKKNSYTENQYISCQTNVSKLHSKKHSYENKSSIQLENLGNFVMKEKKISTIQLSVGKQYSGFTPNLNNGQRLKVIQQIRGFILVKALGQGKFGTVFLSRHKVTRALFAIKKVPKAMIKSHFMIDQFILEVKLQSYFNHNKIVKLYDVFDDSQSIYLVLEYMQQGTLFQYLKKQKQLAQNEAAIKIKDIAQAVQEMHFIGVAHRDIKPQNIVMNNGVCKLCDFGWATLCNQRRKTYCGTFDYAAPQILSGVQYDMSVDLWCLGILAYELMIGKVPFYHLSKKQTMKKILNVDYQKLSYPQTTTLKAKSFIDKLLKKNPQERMKSNELLEHPFLKDAIEQIL